MVDCLVDPSVYSSITVVGIDNEGNSNANTVFEVLSVFMSQSLWADFGEGRHAISLKGQKSR